MVFILHLVRILVAVVWLGNFILDFEVPSPEDNIFLKDVCAYICMYAVSILLLYVNLNMYIHIHS